VEIAEDVKNAGGWIAKLREVKNVKLSNEVSSNQLLLVGSYNSMVDVLKKTGVQAGHLNQFKAFEGVLEHGAALTVPLRGSTAEFGSEHWKFHEVLERFWSNYRGATKLPTVGQYNEALGESLRATGRFSEDQIDVIRQLANSELEAAYRAKGLQFTPQSPVVKVPRPFPMAKPPCSTKP
ncbi:MAG: hypothetical protein NTV94_18065, partial [Planctomycetota bacterium]|nr:hypothetical protein [Planctomycetota bacterium]